MYVQYIGGGGEGVSHMYNTRTAIYKNMNDTAAIAATSAIRLGVPDDSLVMKVLAALVWFADPLTALVSLKGSPWYPNVKF